MKTPMQELLEWVRATLPMDLDTPRMIEEKIESMLEKEKEVMSQVYADGGDWDEVPQPRFENYYNKTFKTKEK
jgi:beta-galactosidase/beta-glucuronidase